LATGNSDKEHPDDDEADPAIRVWEMASGKPIAALLGHLRQSNNLTISPDGRLVASVSGLFREGDPTLRVWDVATGRELRRFDMHPNGANFVAFLPGGRRIVTASWSGGTGLVWDVSDLADRRPPGPSDR
jgi:hypothetical protein